MAKQGFKVLDSEMHMMEPPDLGSATSTLITKHEFRAV